MGLRNILNKFRGMFGSPEGMGHPMSPDEKELECYLERERKAKIKKIVHAYRQKEEREYLQGTRETNMLNQPHTLKDYDMEHEGKKKKAKGRSILNQGKLFIK